jgi:hypothetical protein
MKMFFFTISIFAILIFSANIFTTNTHVPIIINEEIQQTNTSSKSIAINEKGNLVISKNALIFGFICTLAYSLTHIDAYAKYEKLPLLTAGFKIGTKLFQQTVLFTLGGALFNNIINSKPISNVLSSTPALYMFSFLRLCILFAPTK